MENISAVNLRLRLIRAKRYANAVLAGLERVEYRLGAGGFDPRLATPAPNGGLDCSGFTAWIMMISRRPKAGRDWWIETTNIHRDASLDKRVFTPIEHPIAGAFVVYPDRGRQQGHIGLISNVRGPRDFDIIDCTPSQNVWVNGKLKRFRRDQAVKERNGNFFLRRPDHLFVVLTQDLMI